MYTNRIRAIAPDHDPRHIEAWMRLECGTLDWLDPERFIREVLAGVACIKEAGTTFSEQLAKSYGL